MDARNIEQEQNPVPPSMTAMQVAQAYYMSARFHHFPYDDSKKLIKYLVA
jgi:hypothetical protein